MCAGDRKSRAREEERDVGWGCFVFPLWGTCGFITDMVMYFLYSFVSLSNIMRAKYFGKKYFKYLFEKKVKIFNGSVDLEITRVRTSRDSWRIKTSSSYDSPFFHCPYISFLFSDSISLSIMLAVLEQCKKQHCQTEQSVPIKDPRTQEIQCDADMEISQRGQWTWSLLSPGLLAFQICLCLPKFFVLTARRVGNM